MGNTQIESKNKNIQKGYLVIADISGYTSFLVQSELEHAHEILSELTNLIIEKLSAPLRFIELEGDAVFVFAPEVAFEDSERLIDIIEVCYFEFRIRQRQMIINSTCQCNACKSIKDLDLKCVLHFGSFIIQSTPIGFKLVGSDVILVHRLLKNSVIKETGINAYALITKAFIDKAAFSESNLGLKEHREKYADFDEVECRILDLSHSMLRHKAQANYFLKSEDADIEILNELPVPRSVAWAYHLDVERRLKWQTDTSGIKNKPSSNGRTEIGWESHCDHKGYSLIHRIIDWRPFEYISMKTTSVGKSLAKPPSCLATFELNDLPNNRCSVAMRLYAINRNLFTNISMSLLGWLVKKQWRDHYQKLAKLLIEDKQLSDQLIGTEN